MFTLHVVAATSIIRCPEMIFMHKNTTYRFHFNQSFKNFDTSVKLLATVIPQAVVRNSCLIASATGEAVVF